MPGTGATHRHPFDAEHGLMPSMARSHPFAAASTVETMPGTEKAVSPPGRWPKGQAVRVGHAEERASRAPKPPADGGPLPVPP